MESDVATPVALPVADADLDVNLAQLPHAESIDMRRLQEDVQRLRNQMSDIRNLFQHMDELSRATADNMHKARDLSQQMDDQFDFVTHSGRLLWATAENMNIAQDSDVRRNEIELRTNEQEPNTTGRVLIDVIINGVGSADAGHSTGSDSEADTDSESIYGSAHETPLDPALGAHLRLRM